MIDQHEARTLDTILDDIARHDRTARQLFAQALALPPLKPRMVCGCGQPMVWWPPQAAEPDTGFKGHRGFHECACGAVAEADPRDRNAERKDGAA